MLGKVRVLRKRKKKIMNVLKWWKGKGMRVGKHISVFKKQRKLKKNKKKLLETVLLFGHSLRSLGSLEQKQLLL